MKNCSLKTIAILLGVMVSATGCIASPDINVPAQNEAADNTAAPEAATESDVIVTQEESETEDIWNGMSEEELGCLTPDNMPNCQVDENGLHYIDYKGNSYYYGADFNRYVKSVGGNVFLDFPNAWVLLGENDNQTVLGGIDIVKQNADTNYTGADEVFLEVGGSKMLWDMYDHVYTNLNVVDANGDRFQLPDGTEWVYAEAHMMKSTSVFTSSIPTINGPDELGPLEMGVKLNEGLRLDADGNTTHYVGIMRFVDEGGYSHNVYIIDSNYQEAFVPHEEIPTIYADTNFVNDITQNPVVLAESRYTAEEIFPDGFDGYATDTLYYIENGGSYTVYAKSLGCKLSGCTLN